MDDESDARFFVVPYDASGVFMTVRKYRDHLTLSEAKALQAELGRDGVTLLIYPEGCRSRPPPSTAAGRGAA